MKIFSLTLILVLFAAFSVNAGDMVFGLNAGSAVTSFEGQTDAATSISFGAHVGNKVLPILETGLEFNMLASPWEFEADFLGQKMTQKVSQTLVGAYAKVAIPLVVVNPYVRAGIGYYMGNLEFSLNDYSEKADFKGAIGYSVGAGADLLLGFYAEVMYHIVSRELDLEDAGDAADFNNLMINVGYNF
jgi:hypothetical protein